MRDAISRIMTEQRKQRIKHQLVELEAREAQSMLAPIEQPDDTLIVVNFKAKREKLQQELARCEERLDQANVLQA